MKNILLLLTTLFASITMSATVHKVKASDGADVLKSTIAEAATGDTVLVQEGTFTGNFTMKEGVQVSGGWNSDFIEQTEYGTILDANANGRVLNQPSDFSTLTIWSNFTIQNGNLKAIDGNKSLGSGVALFKNGRIVKCLVQNNTYSYSGNCLGGGLGNDSGSAGDVMADNCIIRNNKASHGGGVRIRGTIQNSIIEDNLTEANAAGGVHLQGGRIYNCIIRNNTGKDTGGARLYGGCEMVNCLVYGNTGKGSIGGVSWESGGAAKIINNTIVYNNQEGTDSPSRCGFRAGKADANAVFANNVIWGNKVGGSLSAEQCQGADKSIFTGANAIVNNAVYNATIGVNGIDLKVVDPGFVDAANNDFSLLETSNLVNKGDKTKNTTTKDLAGKQRVRGGLIDLGCYEYQSPESRNTYVKVGDNLQDSINLTVAGYNVYVQAGTFYGNFTMKNAVQVSGGWDANFETKTEYGTILDAQSNGRVLNQAGDFTTLTVWSNFTIQNGKLTAALTDQGGAGVFLNKNGRVQDCLIQNNIVDVATGNAMGGGVSCNSGNADPDTVAYNCVIKNNSATHGGGVRVNGKGVVVYNCIIKGNQTTNNAAGGVHLHNGSHLINCIVRDNKANGDTGGVRLTGGNVSDIINCLIVGNEATGQVGGVAIEGNNKANFINNTVVGNKQNKSGATASLSGVKIKNDIGGSGTFFVNNIIWGNITGDTIAPQGVYYISKYDKNAGQRSYNAIQGQLGDDDTKTCIQLSAENPGFVEPENGDFRLVLSQLVEGGNNAKVVGTKDLAGNNRIINGHVDYGCYEYTGAATLLNEKEESEFEEGETDVVMRRSFVADGSYYTLALPFAMSKEQIATVFGACQISELESSILKSETAENIELRLNFKNVQTIEANKPYLFLPQANVTNPVFEGVTLSKTANDVLTDYADMKSILTPTTFEGLSDGAFFLGTDNILHPLDAEESTVNAYRAYFELHSLEAVGGPKAVCARVSINGAPTAITTQKVEGTMQKVMYNDQIVILRDKKAYTILGTQIY